MLQDMAGRGAERSPVAYGALVAAAERGGARSAAGALFAVRRQLGDDTLCAFDHQLVADELQSISELCNARPLSMFQAATRMCGCDAPVFPASSRNVKRTRSLPHSKPTQTASGWSWGPIRFDVLPWLLLTCAGRAELALQLFDDMLRAGLKPSAATYTAALSACAQGESHRCRCLTAHSNTMQKMVVSHGGLQSQLVMAPVCQSLQSIYNYSSMYHTPMQTMFHSHPIARLPDRRCTIDAVRNHINLLLGLNPKPSIPCRGARRAMGAGSGGVRADAGPRLQARRRRVCQPAGRPRARRPLAARPPHLRPPPGQTDESLLVFTAGPAIASPAALDVCCGLYTCSHLTTYSWCSDPLLGISCLL